MMNIQSDRCLWSLKQMADFLGVTTWTARRIVLSGQVPVVRLPSANSSTGILRRILVDRRDVERLVDVSKERGDSPRQA